MELKYDREADAVYIHLRDRPYAYGRDLDDERRIDYADDNTPIGIELLNVSGGVNLDGLPDMDEIARAFADYEMSVYTIGTYSVDDGIIFSVDLDFVERVLAARPSAEVPEREGVTR